MLQCTTSGNPGQVLDKLLKLGQVVRTPALSMCVRKAVLDLAVCTMNEGCGIIVDIQVV